MNLYFVDYENVNEFGLRGIKALTEDDYVVVFYSINAKSISMERCIELVGSDARIEFIKIEKIGKNYLDFQLSTYLGYLIRTEGIQNVTVISKDTGFDSVLDFWNVRGVTISRREAIDPASVHSVKETKKDEPKREAEVHKESQVKKKEEVPKDSETETQKKELSLPLGGSLPEAYRKKVRTSVKQDKLSPGVYSTIYKAIYECNSKLDLHNTLVKKFGSMKAGVVYGHIKDVYDELHN